MNDQDVLKLRAARIRYDAELFSRYHAKRASYFSFWHNLFQTVIMFFGTSAVFSIFMAEGKPTFLGISGNGIYAAMGAVATFFTLIDMFFKFSDRANIHNNLMRDYRRLLSTLVPKEQDILSIADYERELIDLSTEDPSGRKKYVEAIAHNETMISHNMPEVCQIKLSTFRLRSHF
jgi:hypothetical protein